MAKPFILNQQPATDDWHLLRATEGEDEATLNVPTGQVIVPLATWQAQPALHNRHDVGVWLNNTVEPEHLDLNWSAFPVIALDFPKFTDGRSYSIAYILRNRLGFKNQLRAIGDVLVDQVFYMTRVGFNALSLREDQKIDSALRALNAFTTPYQGSTDDARPFFVRQGA
ncbi:DUF934 domain-containing protein [Hydromonas duriensis]|uniref:Uncharacterized protein (DUF934 family) n=1 Tax=Hydromonas duriensis TaxID=1527608 RepID=A0A4R6Y727_9BURK|nr:DUF934 domain-containing protein [Hydromonas duriensis]TDR30726.1 uncharacterized protein (DUF934 family) [Hydromonas duriensis]